MQEDATVLSAYVCADCACTSNILIDCAHRPRDGEVLSSSCLRELATEGRHIMGIEDEHVYPPMRTHSDQVIIWPSHI
jgi:hypothetical protein